MLNRTRIIAGLMSVALLAGCGSTAADPTAAPQASTPGADGAAETSNTFVYTLTEDPRYLDPAICMSANDNGVVAQLYYPLFRYDGTGSTVKEACADYTVSDDGLVYTFTLAEGNTWSDGKAVTAGDYEYGMKRSIGYGPDSPYSYLLYSIVAGALDAHKATMDVADMTDVGIHALDDMTLEITLDRACPYFTAMLGNSVTFPVRSDFAVEHESNWANDPAVPTNGAFKLVAVRPKEEVEMVKNDTFIHADSVETDTLIAKIIPDLQSQMAAFETGEVDLAMSVPLDVSEKFSGDPALITFDPVVQNTFIWMNTSGNTNPALTDVNVRRALAMSIDREQLIVLIGASATKYPLYGYVPKGMADADGKDFRENADNERRYADFNLDEAKALMEASGYNENNRLAINMSYISSSTNTDICVGLQAMWSQIYVDLELSGSEGQAYASARNAGEYELATGSTSADYLDPYYFLERWVSYNQGHKHVDDATYDAMIEDANAQSDPAVRMAKLHEAEEYLVGDNAYTIPLFGSSSLALMNPAIGGLKSDPTHSVYFDGLTY